MFRAMDSSEQLTILRLVRRSRAHVVQIMLGTLSLILLVFAAPAQAQDVVVKAMQDELARSATQLRLEDMERPYFIGYRVDDVNEVSVAATLGSLSESNASRRRTVGVELRLGDYQLDNSNFLSFRTAGASTQLMSAMTQIPVDDNYAVLRRQLWLVTDAEYKKALEDVSAKRAALQNRKRADEVADFSKEPPTKSLEPAVAVQVDVARAERLVRELSALFRSMPEVFTSSVTLAFENTFMRYVNTEGTIFTRPDLLVRLSVKARTQASDGQPLEDTLEYFAPDPADLPAQDKPTEEIRALGTRLGKLRAASFMERYNGPVLFEGDAAGEVMAQVFAPGLVAMRTPMSDNPQFESTFDQLTAQMGGGSLLEKIGGRVLPEFVNLKDDPLLQEFHRTKLVGGYKVDDEGVAARETTLVEHGILKSLLASRTPVADITRSTGNRRGFGPAPSNLVLTSEKTSNEYDLREELLRRAKQRGRDYGIVVRRVGGGLNAMERMQVLGPHGNPPGATILAVYKLFADGHEELVRGVEVADLNASAFRDIVAVGDKPVVYNRPFAPKGGSAFPMGAIFMADLPVVSYVVPSLLFEEIALKKTNMSFPQPPVSKSPLAETGR